MNPPTDIYQTCLMCKGEKVSLRAGKIIDPCPCCKGEGKTNVLATDIDDIIDKQENISDRCDDISDKCDDILEKLNE